MRVDIVIPQKIVFFTPVGQGLIVLLQADYSIWVAPLVIIPH